MALTIRLTEGEKKDLIEIQDYLGTSTASGTIKDMISTYIEMKDFLHDAESKLTVLELDCNLQKATLRQVKSTFKMLCDLKE